MRIYNLMITTYLLLGITACAIKPPVNYNYEVQALHNEVTADGVVFLKAWGADSKLELAKEQARKNAVRSIIFKGIPNSACKRPLVNEPGAEEKYRDYFQKFFAARGKYNSFIEQSSYEPKDRVKTGGRFRKMYKVGMNVKVNYIQLQRELESQGIIKKFGI